MTQAKFTSAEQRILRILADGERHSKEEIMTALRKGTKRGAISVHMTNIRSKLRPIGYEIICEFYRRKTWYRWIRKVEMS